MCFTTTHDSNWLAFSPWLVRFDRKEALAAAIVKTYQYKGQEPRGSCCIFLKQTSRLPGITSEQMKTISLNCQVNAAFKQAQLLPVLTSEMFVGKYDRQTFCPICARVAPRRESRAVTTRTSARHFPRPCLDESKAERALFAVLALSAVFCVGYAFATMIEGTPNWPTFQAWVGRLLG